jgi:insertion element IS1 protein InsB
VFAAIKLPHAAFVVTKAGANVGQAICCFDDQQ